MKEYITRSIHDADFLIGDLREALHAASRTEGIIIMQLIHDAAKLQARIGELSAAYEEDHQ